MVELAVDETGNHQRKTDHDAGYHAGQEQRGDRHAAGDMGVDNHADRRRDDRTHRRGRQHDSGGESAAVSVLYHPRNHHAADRGDFGDRGAGHAAEEHRGDDDDLRQAAGEPSDQHFGHAHQPYCNTAAGHQRTGEYEKNDREQRECVQRSQHALDDGGVVHAGQQQCCHQRGDADRKRDRHADRHQRDENQAKDDQGHRLSPPTGRFAIRDGRAANRRCS